MKFWTVQHIDSWNIAKEKGYLEGNPDYIFEEFLDSYRWMMEQMTKRLVNYQGNFPIWLWLKKPDLRKSGHLNKKERGVLLEVELNKDEVLISDFMAWHIVLCNDFLALTEAEDDLFEAGKLPMTKEESWTRIFDYKELKKNEYWEG
ncbi:DUF3841 domain-containing protein [Cohnella candidum]|uniref:DUF3841 domain-containing protein n=1 Tax=Cohnella candidum TaxID=2674991 RepID=A0A3G3JW97_9BACL|nr:DUF3841 domain-containing protein [Cohnella candidum]AYQ72495.1 DUF3841 domain-containing protein [Cohnella candidum]